MPVNMTCHKERQCGVTKIKTFLKYLFQTFLAASPLYLPGCYHEDFGSVIQFVFALFTKQGHKQMLQEVKTEKKSEQQEISLLFLFIHTMLFIMKTYSLIPGANNFCARNNKLPLLNIIYYYHISSIIRWEFFPSKTIPKI